MFEMSVEVQEGPGEKNLGEILANFKEEGALEVVFDAPHSAAIEFGSDPHFPPVEPLIGWARRKLGLSEKEAKKAGHAIAWKIFHHGTDPQPFFRPAIDQTRVEINQLLKKGYSMEDMADLILQRAQDNIILKEISDEGTLLSSGKVRRVR